MFSGRSNNYIRIQPTGTVGYIRLRIVGDAHQYGAQDVKEIDLLTNKDNTTEIFSIYISGDLGATAAIEAVDIGSIYAGGSVLHSISAEDNIDGTIAINGNLLAGIYGDTMATVTVSGAGPHTGNIFRRHATTQSGNITISGSYAGDITMNGTVSGNISIGNHCSGTIDVNGSLSGPLTVGGNLSGLISLAAINSDIHIGGNLATSGRITASGGLNGEIRIDGSMFDGDPEHEIHINLTMSAQGAVVVDYDGSDLEHTWYSGATVRVGQQTYDGNNAADRVYEITCLKGDLNNDDAMDSYDIDPFVLAISDHSPGGAYDQAYPGLFGSVDYHANTDCKDGLNAFDIDAFVLRLVNPPVYYDTYPGCEECPAPMASGTGGGTGPEDVAALLSENVAEARLPLVIEFAQFLAAHFGNTARGQFWAAVLAALE